MNDNLAQMIDETDVPVQEETALDLEDTTPSEQDTEEEEDRHEISTVPLSEWFSKNHQNFPNVNPVKVSIRDVDPDATLIFSVENTKDIKNDEGRLVREIEIFKKAKTFPVLNLPGHTMNVFNNGFVIVYDCGQGRFLKCYGVKTGLITQYCISVDGSLIPYSKTKLKKKDTGLDMVEPDMTAIQESLGNELDAEGLQIQYKQVQKSIDDITTKADAIKWMTDKAKEVTDINHLMQIDDVLMWLASS